MKGKRQKAVLHQQKRSKKEAKRKSKRKKWLAKRLLMGLPKRPSFAASIVKAPQVLSFINEPELLLDFFENLRLVCKPKRYVLLDLEDVTSISNDALLLLLTKLQNRNFHKGANILGSRPKCPKTREILENSGFFGIVNHKDDTGTNPIPVSNFMLAQRKHSKKVQPELAQAVIHEATKHLYGKVCEQPGAFRVIEEFMANTCWHANPNEPATERWWLTGFQGPLKDGFKTWCFALVDNGVGILESIELKGWLSAMDWLGFSKTNILENLLNGRVESRTGLKNRGKGLPSMKREFNRKRIFNLHIITNNVYANLAKNVYLTLNIPFSGTFVYFELISQSNGKTSDL